MNIGENELRDLLFANHKQDISTLIAGRRDAVILTGGEFPPISFLLQQKTTGWGQSKFTLTPFDSLLEDRIEGMGPVFVGSYRPGDKIEHWNIEPGNQVALKCDGITVIADVHEVKDDAYKGEIVGLKIILKKAYTERSLVMKSHFLIDTSLAVHVEKYFSNQAFHRTQSLARLLR